MVPRLPLRCWAPLHRASRQLSQQQPHLLRRLPYLPRTSHRGIKYGWSTLPRRSPRPDRYNEQVPGLPAPTFGPAAAQKRRENTTPVRTGVLATKKGMASFYTRKGTRIPCTVLQLDAVQVTAVRTWDRDRYWGLQVGAGARHPDNVTAPMLGFFEARGQAPAEHLAEFRVRDEGGLLPVGVQLRPDWFHIGQWVDVRSTGRGHGFEGGMKRHGFKGQGASHGNSLNHRTIGTTGPSQGGGSRVHPGKKMPGRMGGQRVTVQNLAVLQVDNELGIIVVKGPVGGPKGCVVKIQDAVKKPPPPKEWVEKTKGLALERSPDAEEQLEVARKRHLELKALRKEGRIAEMLAGGIPEAGAPVEAALAA